MELDRFRTLLDRQSGVVARRQLLDGGADDNDIRRWIRRRELARVHTGVYANHTGPLTWSSRAWAAVLFHWPAALAHDSVINRAGDVIHVAIDESRTASRLARVRVHRLVGFEERVQWNLGPPRVRMEDALLSRCGEATTRVDALAVLTDACRRWITTPTRLAAELHRRPTVAHRGWLLQLLDEAAEGVQSLLESRYRRRVERAHGLPRPDRQRRERTEDGVVHRDVTYEALRLVIELDGRIGHELSHDRWDDQDRDLLVAGDEVMTLRIGWRHCDSTPCRTAGRLAQVLRTRGWRGRPIRCGPSCQLPVVEERGLSGTR
ncbi:MAG TPA: hypothetical protein VFG72_08820 [Marmoricola sp.]|nr:hypothetical protein [Marmoricola sp.]